MALKTQLSFNAGEIDPVLHDNVTLERFSKGLETARNVMVSKTGSLLSRFSTAFFASGKNSNEKIRVFSPPNSRVVTIWGSNYVRIYDFEGNFLDEDSHSYGEENLFKLHFTVQGSFIYVFLKGFITSKYRYEDEFGFYGFESPGSIYSTPSAPFASGNTIVGPPTGYEVEYAATKVINGQESIPYILSSPPYKLPVTAGHSNELNIECFGRTLSGGGSLAPEEVRVYRRPLNGGVFGYIGSTTDIVSPSTTFPADPNSYVANFIDFGSDADFTNTPPEIITYLGLDSQDILDLKGRTGCVYQQRLLITTEDDVEAILASRPGYPNNFYRDFPYDADSALKFKSGTSGRAEVLHMIDNDGLIVFTTQGVYINLGVLSIDNIALEKKGNWVIDENIPPLVIPGGVFFVDTLTKSVKQLRYSLEASSYQSIDHTIFSNHLFREKQISSWAYQEGNTPIVSVTFTDGTFATFTYHQEHQMRAWTRHESAYPIEQFAGTATSDASFIVVNKNGNREVHVTLPRFVDGNTVANNPEWNKLGFNYPMDGLTTFSNLLNDSLTADEVFDVSYQTNPGDATYADGIVEITTSSGTTIFSTYSVGDSIRYFNPNDNSIIDFEITQKNSDSNIFAEPSEAIPSNILEVGDTVNLRFYEILTEITVPTQYSNENLAMVIDGNVIHSPNNDVENYGAFEVTTTPNTYTLPEPGAIVVIGRPFVMDTKTLNISTVSQSPTIVESVNVNKLYMRVYKSRGLFVSNKFPEEADGEKDGSSVSGMEDIDVYDVNPEGIIANRSKQPDSKRYEITIPGSWDSQGRISIRQVDPLHFEILSIIPDVEVLNRSNR